MRRLILLILALACVVAVPAQKKTTARKVVPTSKGRQKNVAGSTSKKRETTPKKKATAKKRDASYGNQEIKGLQSQRAAVRKKIHQQELALKANKADVQKRLKNLLVINSEINEKQKSINGIQQDISHLDNNISLLQSQLETLTEQLQDRKAKYIRSMRYMARHRTVQDKLMFVFSAKSLTQIYRRMRFVREYAAYQKVQGELVKSKQAQVTAKHEQLQAVKGQKRTLLTKSQNARAELEGKQTEQQEVVKGLQKQQKTIQDVIAQQRQKDSELNAQIDRLIAIEVAKAKARAEAEAKRKAAEAAAAAKARAEELARKKVAAEAAARENANRIAAAKEREARLKLEAESAARSNNAAAKAKAEQEALEARADREAAERKARADEARSKKEIATARRNADEAAEYSSVDRKLSGGFAANKGRLPMPISGQCRIVSHFGQYSVEGLKGITLDNKGINILGSPGAVVRSVYDGEVSAVIPWSGTFVVMVRHGGYISVYCNLSSVAVSRGMKVSTRQALGNVGSDHILQFQLRQGTAKLNPEAWLSR